MKTQTDKTQEKGTTPIQRVQQEQSNGGTAQLTDKRKSTMYQQKLQKGMHVASENSANPIQCKTNKTGLPDNLKTGIENLSGYSMDDVKVHYNSSKPAQLQAHAYAQGTDIHVASGQEKHLPHEAWHVVQQKQGRVQPTRQLKSKVNINDDAGLEREADVMGNKAMNTVQKISITADDKIGLPNKDCNTIINVAQLAPDSASYERARMIAEDADLTDNVKFKPLTGSGVNKQVYKVIGEPWVVLALSKIRKHGIIDEVEQLIKMRETIPTASIGEHNNDVDSIIFKVTMPTKTYGQQRKQPVMIDNKCTDHEIITDKSKQQGYAFLEEFIPGIEISKENTTFHMKDVQAFIENVIKEMKSKPEGERLRLKGQAIVDLKDIKKYVNKKAIPDFQVRYNSLTGNIVVLDPGASAAQTDIKMNQKWVNLWLSYLTEEKLWKSV